MRAIRRFLGWFLLAFGGINLFPNPALGLVLLLWGILLLPAVNRMIEDRGWSLGGWKRLGIVVVSFIIMVVATPSSPESSEPEADFTPTAISSVSPSPTPSLTPSPIPSLTPTYIRPQVAENGSPFPSTSGYIEGYPREFTNGHSTVTVDNSQNDSDVLVKLFSLDTEPPKPARVFFIRAGEKFTVESVAPGTYDVRHQDLDTGGLSRTEPLEIEEEETAEGVNFTQLTLTLFKVANGNLETYPLSPGEF